MATTFKGDLSVTNDVSADKFVGKLDGKISMTKSTYKVGSADAVAAAGAAPTKAEYDAVVTLANECKAKLNALVEKLG